MKNIHLIPTDKPSRLGYLTKKGKELFNDLRLFDTLMPNILDSENQHLYITTDEEIREGDYVIEDIGGVVYGPIDRESIVENPKKIILTTDPDLIADGVQAIDEDFLQWFINNSSCESIKTLWTIPADKIEKEYRIEIPQEEPKQEYNNLNYGGGFTEEDIKRNSIKKQETLEEAALNYSIYNEQINKAIQEAVKFGSKWMEERMYSEEEVKLLLDKVLIDHSDIVLADIPEWFENNKKK